VRAYDTYRQEFRTFRLNRIQQATSTSSLEKSRPLSQDAEWLRHINLTLAPHPRRENQDALRIDLGLTNKPVKNITVNAVTAGFVLIDLRVDCSADGFLDPYEYHLKLMNRHELENVGSMNIAPGYRT